MAYIVIKEINKINFGKIQVGKILIKQNKGLYYGEKWICDIGSPREENCCKRIY
jgi:hypothetical protein